MSQEVESIGQYDALDFDTGLEAFRRSPEFRGPVEELDDHDHDHANGHFASIYENREEQFAAAIPFVRQGLERGEQCLYIADDNSREEVLEAMDEAGIAVDTALESGALTVTTARETYLQGGSFDLEESLALLEEGMSEATTDFEGFRVAAEETWLLETSSTIEEFLALESRANELFHDENCIALCQYNRERFPSDVIHEVTETHPHLIYDNTIFRNFYYTPPEEFFGPDQPKREVDRRLETLQERTEAKSELQDHKQYLRELHETTANNDLSFEEMVEELLELGCKRFGLRGGALSHLPSWDGDFRAEVTVGPEMPEQPGVLPVQPGESCFCRRAIRRDDATAVPDTVERGWDDDDVYQEIGLQTYFGIKVTAGSDPYGTLWFYDTSAREESFTDDERTFLEMMGQWVSTELERTERNRAQRKLYDITADSSLSFDQKVEQLLDLGRDRFGLDMGFFLQKQGDEFRVVKTRGTDLEEGVATVSANPDQYCKRTITVSAPVGVEDVVEAGWDDDPLYREYDLGCYLGTRVTDNTGVFGSVCFADSSSRDLEFTDAEYTFLDLMGQWLSYELEREERERYLREQNEITADAERSFEEKLQALFDLGCERFDLELGAVASVDQETDTFEVEYTSDDHEYFEPGVELPLSETYCTVATESGGPASVSDPLEEGYEDVTVHREFGLKAYLGTCVEVEGDLDRTFFFVTDEPRDEPFSDAERTFHHMMGEWLRKELERKQHEEQLQQKNDRLESFASLLAHELRNPVTIGQIYSQQLSGEAGSEAVEYVTEAFDRIENMIDIMLVLTRGREAVGERTSVELGTVAREEWSDADTLDAALEVGIDHTIQADETYVRHLFRNLIENAIEHGGDDVTITVGELPTGFYVADDGAGIPAEKRDVVFEAGYTTASDNGGMGLGLAFVRELAEVYEWDCTVTESEAGGARFEFRNVVRGPQSD